MVINVKTFGICLLWVQSHLRTSKNIVGITISIISKPHSSHKYLSPDICSTIKSLRFRTIILAVKVFHGLYNGVNIALVVVG